VNPNELGFHLAGTLSDGNKGVNETTISNRLLLSSESSHRLVPLTN